MGRKILALFLAFGVVVGYGHALASLAHHHHGWPDRPACHRHVDPSAP
jgi:hypothetical protein